MPIRTASRRRIRSALALGIGSRFRNEIPTEEATAPASRPSDSVVPQSRAGGRARGPKPIYIYPGLLRVVRHTAIALDARCPATVYRAEQHTSTQCCICLDDFRSSDLVRKIPCGHSFHSLCLLRWLQQHDRCPLCMDVVSSHPVKERIRITFPNSTTVPTARAENQASVPESTATGTQTPIPAQDPTATPAPTRTCSPTCSHACANASAPQTRPASVPLAGSSITESEPDSSNAQSAMAPTTKKKKSPRTYSYIVHVSWRPYHAIHSSADD